MGLFDIADGASTRPDLRRLRILLVASTSLSFAGFAAVAPAIAQDAATGGPRAQSDQKGEVVVVTARHREEDLQDVPAAITALGGEFLTDAGADSIEEVAKLVPSIQFSNFNPRNSQINIRGLGSAANLANDGLEPGVGFYVDQVYYARPATSTFDLIDLESIQVLRGPQGTLYGKNTTAGVISVSTAAPAFTPEAAFELTAGDYGYGQAKVSLTGPILGDTLAARFSAATTTREGLVTNVFDGGKDNNYRNTTLRGQLLFQPSDLFSLRVSADYNKQNTSCCTLVLSDIVTPANGVNFVTFSQASGFTPVVEPFSRRSNTNAEIYARQESGGVSAIAEWTLPGAVLTSVTAWRYWDWSPSNDLDSSPLDIFRKAQVSDEQDQYSQELRLASSGDNTIDYVAGLYLFQEDLDNLGVTEFGALAVRSLVNPALPGLILTGVRQTAEGRLKTKSYAAFGQGVWHLTPALDVAAGLRYTQDRKDGRYVSVQTGGTPLAGPLAAFQALRNGLAPNASFETSSKDGRWSGQLGLSYQASDTVLLYANYARGNKAGGLNLAVLPSLAKTIVAPEVIDNTEAGVKSELFGGTTTLNLAVFKETAKDYQANTVDPVVLRAYISNIPEVSSRGVELDMMSRPADGLSLYLSTAYTDVSYSSFPSAPCGLEAITSPSCNLTGKRAAGVPLWSAAAGGEYERPVSLMGQDLDAFVAGDYSYRSAYDSVGNSRYTVIDEVGLVNLRFGLRSPDRGWSAYVWAKNLLDEEYLATKTPLFSNGGLYSNLGDPRMVGVTFRATR